jgi:hypothetical protein
MKIILTTGFLSTAICLSLSTLLIIHICFHINEALAISRLWPQVIQRPLGYLRLCMDAVEAAQSEFSI